MPSTYSLHQNYPNPFQSQTSIRYAIPGNPLGNESQFFTSLKIYDLSGRLVRVLVHEYQQPGRYTAVWDGRDCCRFPVPAGTYFCRFDSGDYRATRKLLVLR
ncbi:MAG: hypothetical protein AMJ46_13530 [Latescibacteria bacterium DG_63]|nr:MAG: hypothetical protein AMJ46_13530 [Latescibacteria bacterium DG_63]